MCIEFANGVCDALAPMNVLFRMIVMMSPIVGYWLTQESLASLLEQAGVNGVTGTDIGGFFIDWQLWIASRRQKISTA